MKYSLCLTNYNRYEMLIESFAQVIDDPRINDIVISDDCSDVEIYNKLVSYFSVHKYGYKVTMWRNGENLGMLRNKAKVLSNAENDFCILADSDNIYDKSYLDALEGITLDAMIIYAPEWAMDKFDFRQFAGHCYDKDSVKSLIAYPMGFTLLNCCNYVINKNALPFDENLSVKASDSIWIIYCLLKKGYKLCVVRNMRYIHRVHSGSGFLENCQENLDKAEQIKHQILQL